MSSEATAVTAVSKDYDHRAIEAAANAQWKSGDVYRVDEQAKDQKGQLKKNTTLAQCCLTHLESCTWVMCVTTPSMM